MDYVAAVDEMYGMVKAASASWNAIFGYVPELRWQGVPIDGRPDPSKSWARVSNKIVSSPQATLGDVAGKHRYRETGLLYIQVFGSRNETGAKNFAFQGAIVMQKAFRAPSPSGEIVFREAKVVDAQLDATEQWYGFNTVVTFEYDTIQ